YRRMRRRRSIPAAQARGRSPGVDTPRIDTVRLGGIDPHRRFLYAATRLTNGNFTEDALLDVDGTIVRAARNQQALRPAAARQSARGDAVARSACAGRC